MLHKILALIIIILLVFQLYKMKYKYKKNKENFISENLIVLNDNNKDMVHINKVLKEYAMSGKIVNDDNFYTMNKISTDNEINQFRDDFFDFRTHHINKKSINIDPVDKINLLDINDSKCSTIQNIYDNITHNNYRNLTT